MSFNVFQAYRSFREQYVDFLVERTLGLFPPSATSGDRNRWENARRQLRDVWLDPNHPENSLFARPMLEGRFPYRTRLETPSDLVRDGTLHRLMPQFLTREANPPADFHPYGHQLKTIRESKDNHVIVASGTGSGKTECFLWSAINNLLFRADGPADNLADDGVRILLVYPTNALVKDQLKRIVGFLKDKHPLLRVGMFTSQTPE